MTSPAINATPAASASADGVLAISDLTVARGGREVLHGISLEVRPGAVTSLLGANGAGKSTTVLTIGGLLKPLRGKVELAGRNVTGLSPEKVRAAGIAIVPEGRRLLRSLTVQDNLRVATFAMKRPDAKLGIERALALFPELKARWDVPTGALSGGEQQMVALAQAVSSQPTYLFVDELSLGLAPVIVKRLVPLLTQIAASGVGVLLIEQFAHVALGVADMAYVMESGRIRYYGSTETLRTNPEILHSAYLLRD